MLLFKIVKLILFIFQSTTIATDQIKSNPAKSAKHRQNYSKIDHKTQQNLTRETLKEQTKPNQTKRRRKSRKIEKYNHARRIYAQFITDKDYYYY